MLPLGLEHEYRTIARASSLAYAAISMVEARRLAIAVRDRYRVDIDHTARAIACLATLAFGEAGEVRTDYLAAMRGDIGKEFEIGTTELGLAYYQSDADSLKRDGSFGLGLNDVDTVLKSIAVILAMLVGETVAKDVLNGARKYAKLESDAEIEAWTDVALEAIMPTDIPPRPTTEPSPPANDSQGTIDDEQPVLVYRDAARLLDLLYQAEVQALDHAVRMEQRQTDHHTDDPAWTIRKAVAHAERRALCAARTLLTQAVPALAPLVESKGSPWTKIGVAKSNIELLPSPREFAWGAPSVNGLSPTVFDNQDALEVQLALPDEAGMHPAYSSVGHEVSDRIAALVCRLVNRNIPARFAVFRIELHGEDYRDVFRTNAELPPLASETTSSSFGTVPCPHCGADQEVPPPAEDPALFAGDPVTHQCTECKRESEMRIEDRAHVYLRARMPPRKLFGTT